MIELIRSGLTRDDGMDISAYSAEYIKNNNIDPFFGTKNDILKSQFTTNVQANLSLITEYITQLSVNGIYEGKDKLFKYLLFQAFFSFIFVVIIFIGLYSLNMIPETVLTSFVAVTAYIRNHIHTILAWMYSILLKIKHNIGRIFHT